MLALYGSKVCWHLTATLDLWAATAPTRPTPLPCATFRVKRSRPLSRVMDAFYERKGLDAGTGRFVFDGHRVQRDDTPASLDIKDGDSIDCFVEQIGGIKA